MAERFIACFLRTGRTLERDAGSGFADAEDGDATVGKDLEPAPCDGFREAKAKSRKRRSGARRQEHGHVYGENGERSGAEPEEVADGSSHGVAGDVSGGPR